MASGLRYRHRPGPRTRPGQLDQSKRGIGSSGSSKLTKPIHKLRMIGTVKSFEAGNFCEMILFNIYVKLRAGRFFFSHFCLGSNCQAQQASYSKWLQIRKSHR